MAGTGDLAAHARTRLDASCYLVLGTSDPDGRPWTSPVDVAADGLRDYHWVSATDARQAFDGHDRAAVLRPGRAAASWY